MRIEDQIIPHVYATHENFYIPQDRIAISSTGRWSLSSGGFAGCMGVIVGPAGQGETGGMIAHIAESGARGGDGNFVPYTKEIVSCMLDWLRPAAWNRVEVALFKGMGAHSFPDMGEWLTGAFPRLVQQVHDARARSRELDSGGFLFDTRSQTVYINCYPGPSDVRSLAAAETYENLGQEIAFRNSNTLAGGRIKYRYYHLP